MRLKYFIIIACKIIGLYSIFLTSELSSPYLALELFTNLRVFPTNLLCDVQEILGEGSSWNAIKVGTSRSEDLQRYIYSLSKKYKSITTDNIDSNLQFYLNDFNEQQLTANPYGIQACVKDGTITAMSILLSSNSKAYLSEYVDMYGIPDAVTWSEYSPVTRIVFWFRKGIAAEIATTDDNSFGLVVRITYFPYQDVKNYKVKWPYYWTFSPEHPLSKIKELHEFIHVHGEQNPFNFNYVI